jgi:hypothetical protein
MNKEVVMKSKWFPNFFASLMVLLMSASESAAGKPVTIGFVCILEI